MTQHVDALIVGSGFGGSITALRLAEDGRQVVVLERGEGKRTRDFRQTQDPRYLFSLYHTLQNVDGSAVFRVAKTLGGGSTVFSGTMIRSPSDALEATDAEGARLWPESYSRANLDPYFEMVEEKMMVQRVRWQDVPRKGGIFAKMLAHSGYTCDRVSMNYVDCVQCGWCQFGCQFERKQSALLNYIPEAEALGVEFRCECDVVRLEPDGTGYLVHYIDRYGGSVSIGADLVVLSAGAIDTPVILLRSTNELNSLSEQLGKNLNNNGDIFFVCLAPEGEDPIQQYKGRDNGGVMTYEFWEEEKFTFHPGGGPPAMLAALDIHREGGPEPASWGLVNKHLMRDTYARRMFGIVSIGLVPGPGSIAMAEGSQTPSLLFPFTDELNSYAQRVERRAREVVEGYGGELLLTTKGSFKWGTDHPLGTCRMGASVDDSVVDEHGEVHGYPRLYINDGSIIPGGTGVNPAATIAAIAERNAAHIVRQG